MMHCEEMARFGKKGASPAPSPVLGPPWRYETDEHPKKKHHWSKPMAGFVERRDGTRVSKCPAGFSLVLAAQLVNEGIPSPTDLAPTTWPSQIFVVHDGVLYRAVPTNPGRSYHAYPVDSDDLRLVPRDVLEKIFERARALNCERKLRRWIG
jgi:hypothetical protein